MTVVRDVSSAVTTSLPSPIQKLSVTSPSPVRSQRTFLGLVLVQICAAVNSRSIGIAVSLNSTMLPGRSKTATPFAVSPRPAKCMVNGAPPPPRR